MAMDFDKYKTQVENLLDCINTGDEENAQTIIDELTRIRETELFRELGALTRDLHDTLKTFEIDPTIVDITEKQIPDATERLNYVITTTETAAHKTLEAIEAAQPVAEEISASAHELGKQWEKFKNRNLTPEEFRQLSRDLEAYLEAAVSNGDVLRARMNEALMAQEYQDITGQILRRVIEMVHMVEENLVYLIKISSGQKAVPRSDPKAEEIARKAEDIKGHGPQVPGAETSPDVMSGQDDVDDLLSSLGF